MIVVTGAAGFIGSCLVSYLNKKGKVNLILVDEFETTEKFPNLERKGYQKKIHRNDFLEWFEANAQKIEFVFHIGARTDTTEFDVAIFDELNVNYTQAIWKICSINEIGLVYASSAATYGLGEFGYEDNHDVIDKLVPLNPYGRSKNDFDKWALTQDNSPPFWCGLKFFNVYGPNEYHKGRMASVIFHAFHQIKENGSMKLFQSHHPDYRDGEQKRDFIYVKDLIDVCYWMSEARPLSGLYNLGSGKARTFIDLAKGTYAALSKEENITFIPTPEDIRDKYQYFTEANMSKLRAVGYEKPFTPLEEGIKDYVVNYLNTQNHY
ncbi:MAG: ADP-glyceromanno-heptose 6-epimerase [Verrucomicrobia bacterium]|nr:ADP-glyceromanno-heptose 6-epimerase [Verrucomicrobiota bacterium]|tara:strand:- start:133 stop:1098 length:966 start_codon:yes stop_codon:yes gene_type:complete